ncbi:PREDICTED: pentatricopeptide repeat-containing protein 2, mitochondrial-like [Nicrophorus vespilloides]|uniref:Pentatricopeptide repeat-containing protein 2, mitochondrial-like n=1 Tax=Nicrophorus vespilloides TaxID=110193 RepID=A0ABM1MQL2_NICVS|nr:PREDICTED: pentatricopeptide repeat-containing protein 2, mitochondrial-like [Nicrophorus vespilloides]
MANVLNILLKNTALCPLKHAVKPQLVSLFQTQVRTLYSESTLGIDGYKAQRLRTQNQLSNIAEKFRTKMHDYTSDDSKNMIFTEDLKNMIHLAENDDVDLIIKMMNRFNEQNKQLRFGTFVFGPVVMRMFYYLNKPDEALKCFKSENLKGFFDQLITYQLLMDLMYNNQRYQDILDLFEDIRERQIESTQFPRNIIVLTLAACYKLNTKESWDFALNLWNKLMEAGHMPMRRAVTFCAALALKQNNPSACLEMISSAKNQNYTTVRNLKVLALTQVGRIEDVLPILKSVYNQDDSMKNQTFNVDVIELIKEQVEKLDSVEVKQEFSKIHSYLKDNHISDMTLEEQLCLEIATPPFLGNKRNNYNNTQDMRYNRFQRRNDDFTKRRPFDSKRPGLSDMQ